MATRLERAGRYEVVWFPALAAIQGVWLEWHTPAELVVLVTLIPNRTQVEDAATAYQRKLQATQEEVSDYRQYAATSGKVVSGIVIGDSASGVAKNPVKHRTVDRRARLLADDRPSGTYQPADPYQSFQSQKNYH